MEDITNQIDNVNRFGMSERPIQILVMNVHKLTWLLPKGGMTMLKDYTDAWLDLMEDSFAIQEDEEPITHKEWEEYYQSIYSDWYDTQTEERFKQRDNVNQGDNPVVSDGLTGKD
jgi:hypothetical protein